MPNILTKAGSLISGKSAFTATVQTLLVKFFIIAINMATGIITARMLGLEGRGELAAIILWPQFLAYTMTFGLPQALLYNLKEYPEKKSELFSVGLIMAAVSGILASTVGIYFMPQWLSNYSPGVIQAAQWLMLMAPISLLELVIIVSFEANGDFTKSNQIRYFVPIITLGTIFLFVLFQIRNPTVYSLAYLLPHIPVSIWMLAQIWNQYNPRIKDTLGSTKILLSYGIRSYGIDLLGAVSGQIGQALIVGLLTAASVGLYTIAISLSRMLNTFESAIITVLLPSVAARPVREIVYFTGQAVRISTFLTILCVIPLAICAPFLLSLLYGPDFAQATSVFRILLIEVLISGIVWVLAQAFMAAGKPGIVTVFQGLGLAVTVPLMFILVPPYGLNGAGFALLISTVIRFVSVLICYPVVLKVNPPGLLLKPADLKYLKKSFLNRK